MPASLMQMTKLSCSSYANSLCINQLIFTPRW